MFLEVSWAGEVTQEIDGTFVAFVPGLGIGSGIEEHLTDFQTPHVGGSMQGGVAVGMTTGARERSVGRRTSSVEGDAAFFIDGRRGIAEGDGSGDGECLGVDFGNCVANGIKDPSNVCGLLEERAT